MNRQEIRELFESLARSQGAYGRLLDSIDSHENPNEVWGELEAQNFKDPIDVILFIEC